MEMKDFGYFKAYLFVFLLFLIATYLTNYSIRTFRKVTVRKFAKGLWDHYLKKYIKSDNNKIEWLWTGKSNTILQKWIESWRVIVNDALLWSLIRVIVTVAMVFSMIALSMWWYTLIIVVIIFAIMILLAWWGTRRTRYIRKERRDIAIQYDRSLVRLIMSKFEVLQNDKIQKELEVISDFFSRIIYRDKKESKWFIIASDIPRALIDFLKLGLVFWYWTQIFSWQATFAEFTLIWMLMNQITGVLFEANDMMLNYYDQITHVGKLRDTFDEMPKLRWYEEWNIFKYQKWNIILDNITFSYWNQNILESFNLEIEWWKKTAFVGESGSGKTTLIKLISGYVHPDSGFVEIDWQKLSEVSLKSYYKNIWYLTQDPNVFDGSIMDNLLYWTVKKPTKKEIDEAIKLSRCEFIYSLKNWLETQIWEKWIRLSGGQKQRLAIAKLMLKNPKIIFLDEPTSALDSFSEEDIAKAFDNLFKWRTVIVVAHRLQTVKQADVIHVMQDGKIVESGNHKQLLAKKWIYYKMIELQSGF